MITRRGLVGPALMFFAALCGGVAVAQTVPIGADLNVSPRRVTFDGASRSDTVLVFNRGGQPATYNIDLVDRVMTPDGRITAVADLGASPDGAAAAARLKSARSMITFTPRRVVLAPGETQVVRLRLLRPADLAPGEYRTHFTVTAVPPPDEGLTADDATAKASGGLSVRLTALFSISIPVIVRQGKVEAQAGFADIHYAPQAGAGEAGVVLANVVRTGTGSLYGDVEVRLAGDKRSGALLGAERGIGVYPEIDHRAVAVPLNRKLVSGERLEIAFKDQDIKPDRVMATESFTVP